MNTARALDELNQDRKLIEQDMQREALTIVEKLAFDTEIELPSALCFSARLASGRGWTLSLANKRKISSSGNRFCPWR